jgi:hypothetical protein
MPRGFGLFSFRAFAPKRSQGMPSETHEGYEKPKEAGR